MFLNEIQIRFTTNQRLILEGKNGLYEDILQFKKMFLFSFFFQNKIKTFCDWFKKNLFKDFQMLLERKMMLQTQK